MKMFSTCMNIINTEIPQIFQRKCSNVFELPYNKCRCTAKTKYRNFETNIPRKEYPGLSPNFHMQASVSDLYIPTIGLPILLEEICRPILELYKSLTDKLMWKLGPRPHYSQKRDT